MKSKRVLVVGDLCADLVMTGLDRMPELGKERMAEDFSVHPGGSSLNTACGLARLGVPTALCGCLGDDLFGRFVREQLSERGLDISRVANCAPIRTGLSIALNVGGDRAFATYGGSLLAGRYEDLPRDLFAGFDHMHLGSFFFMKGIDPPRLIADARAAGLTVSVDTGYDPEERWDDGLRECLPLVDFFLINEVEVKAIARTDDVASAVRILSCQTPGLGVKLGPAGSVFAKDGRIWRAKPMPVGRVVDTTGAGDAFNAGFLAGWLLGGCWGDCLRFGNVCGALVAQTAGALAGQPTLAQAQKNCAALLVEESSLGEWEEAPGI